MAKVHSAKLGNLWQPDDLDALAEAIRQGDNRVVRSYEDWIASQPDGVASKLLNDALRVGPALVRMWAVRYAGEHCRRSAVDFALQVLDDPDDEVRSAAIQVLSAGATQSSRSRLLQDHLLKELGTENTILALWAIARHRMPVGEEVNRYALTVNPDHVYHKLAIVVSAYLKHDVSGVVHLLHDSVYCRWAALLLARLGTSEALHLARSSLGVDQPCQDQAAAAIAHLQHVVDTGLEGWNDGFRLQLSNSVAAQRERQRRLAEFLDSAGLMRRKGKSS